MRREGLSFLALAGADLAALLGALLVGLALRTYLFPLLPGLFPGRPSWQPEYLWFLAIGVGVFAYEGLYTRRRTAWEELRHLCRGMVVAFVVFLALMTVLKQGAEISRAAVISAWLLSPLLLILSRLAAKRALRRSSFWPRRILILGCGDEALGLARHLLSFPELGYRLVGFLCEAGEKPGALGPSLGALDDLEETAAVHEIDEVVVALPKSSRLVQFEMLTRAESLVPKVSILPELFDADKLNVAVESVERFFLLTFRNNLMRPANRLLKSCFEILTILAFSPLWALLLPALALAVKASSPGPVFFRQKRIGRGGRHFDCLKFRTMVRDAEERLEAHLAANPRARAEWEAEHKLKDDPRITPVGRLLRSTSLDELPQLLNVLAGQMSLVGPRPIVDAEISKYGPYFRYYQEVCPGISGLWQVSGRNDVDYEQRVMLDTFYVRNWSLWMDVVILLRTIPAVLKKEGAY